MEGNLHLLDCRRSIPLEKHSSPPKLSFSAFLRGHGDGTARLLIHDTYRPRGFAATGENGNPSGPFHLSSQETVELPFPSRGTGTSHKPQSCMHVESFITNRSFLSRHTLLLSRVLKLFFSSTTITQQQLHLMPYLEVNLREG